MGFDDVARTDGAVSADSSDAALDRPNRAFLTPETMAGDFGGIAAADALCATEATAAGLPGQFIALLSTSTVNANDRIADSRGWVRVDGTPLADRPSDFFLGGHLLAPLDRPADGGAVPPYANVWTATNANGMFDPANGACADWTSQTGKALTGFHNRSVPFDVATVASVCTTPAHLYCVEIGHQAPVQPLVGTGRIAFISGFVADNLGVAAFDAACQMDANAAGLPGTYLAAVTTTTQSAASRFTTTAAWQRVDGMPVTASGDALFAGTRLLAFLDQGADGTPLTNALFVTQLRTGGAPNALGTAASTCNDWSATTGTQDSGTMNSVAGIEFWSGSSGGCNGTQRMVCLQQ